MRFYLDTCLLVAALTSEAATGGCQEWLSLRSGDQLYISDWVITEFAAALSMKLRGKQIEITERATSLAAFGQLSRTSLETLAIGPAEFRRAALLVNQHTLGLRAGDALHIAICAECGTSLCTLDRRMADAARAMGVQSQIIEGAGNR